MKRKLHSNALVAAVSIASERPVYGASALADRDVQAFPTLSPIATLKRPEGRAPIHLPQPSALLRSAPFTVLQLTHIVTRQVG